MLSPNNNGGLSGPHQTFSPPGAVPCSATLGQGPNYNDLTAPQIAFLQEAFTPGAIVSSPAVAGLCYTGNSAVNTNIARGFITIDYARHCSASFPDQPNYFNAGGTGVAGNENVLWGDWFLADPGNDFAQGFELVHVEADSTLENTTDLADGFPFTFYGVVQDPATDFNAREALGSVYATRYGTGPPFDGTDLIVWRDPFDPDVPNNGYNGSPVACAAANGTFGQVQIVAFDEMENPVIFVDPTCPSGALPGCTGIVQTPFPLCTNRTGVGIDLNVQGNDYGWVFLNLNDVGAGATVSHNQAWVSTVMQASGRFSVGFHAIQLNNLTMGSDPLAANLQILIP